MVCSIIYISNQGVSVTVNHVRFPTFSIQQWTATTVPQNYTLNRENFPNLENSFIKFSSSICKYTWIWPNFLSLAFLRWILHLLALCACNFMRFWTVEWILWSSVWSGCCSCCSINTSLVYWAKKTNTINKWIWKVAGSDNDCESYILLVAVAAKQAPFILLPTFVINH